MAEKTAVQKHLELCTAVRDQLEAVQQECGQDHPVNLAKLNHELTKHILWAREFRGVVANAFLNYNPPTSPRFDDSPSLPMQGRAAGR